MTAEPRMERRTTSRKSRRKRPAQKKSLQAILYRLDNGEISVAAAYDEVQESDRVQRSPFNRLLELIAG